MTNKRATLYILSLCAVGHQLNAAALAAHLIDKKPEQAAAFFNEFFGERPFFISQSYSFPPQHFKERWEAHQELIKNLSDAETVFEREITDATQTFSNENGKKTGKARRITAQLKEGLSPEGVLKDSLEPMINVQFDEVGHPEKEVSRQLMRDQLTEITSRHCATMSALVNRLDAAAGWPRHVPDAQQRIYGIRVVVAPPDRIELKAP